MRFLALLALVLLPSLSEAAPSPTCAKLRFITRGESCQSLRAEFDLTACRERPSRVRARVECGENNTAVASAESGSYTYTANLKREGGAWGAGDWALSGKVKRAKKAKAEAPAPQAEPSEPAPAPQAPAAAPPSTGMIFTGHFDVYYGHNFNRPAPVTPLANTNPASAAVRPGNTALRYFDTYSNQLGFNLVELAFTFSRKEASLAVDLDFGQLADINASLLDPSGAVLVEEVSKNVGRAILTYSPSSVPGFVIEAGKMPTHVGLEMIKPKDNWNYSRAYLFGFGVPFWHVGLHAGYTIPSINTQASLYLYNGWGTLYDVNDAPTLGAQLKWSPNEKFSILYNYIGGPEQPNDNADRLVVHDVNFTWALLPHHLTLAADAIHGYEDGVTTAVKAGRATWTAAEVLLHWQVNPRLALTPRYEIFHDTHGYRLGGGAPDVMTSTTLTAGYLVTDGLDMRLEGRMDKSSIDGRFATKHGTTDTQVTATWAVLYSI